MYSFVIPAFNEEKNVVLIYQRLLDIMKKHEKGFEIIFVDDGSRDNTKETLVKLANEDKRLKVISLSRNFGHQSALTAGLKYAKGDAIISMDCDLQDPPEVIDQMIEKWKEGFDIVYARRKTRHDNFIKKHTALLYYKLLDRFSDTKIPRNVGDFRLIDKKVHKELILLNEKAIYMRGLVAWMGYKHTFVDFDRPERIHGKTGYSWEKMIRLAMDGMLNFSLMPLKFGFVIGSFSIVMGFLFLVYMFFDSIINHSIYELIKWLVVVMFIFVGFIFILLWILGEYIGRIYNESKGRPTYLVDEKFNFDENINA
ncbi:MAG: glycosyltransferase [Bacteroidales bacterium]|nr:glycosyltransferase [Bacteroidales bacterium]